MGKRISNFKTNKHVEINLRLDFLFQWFGDLLFYGGLEKLMNFKIANLTHSAIGSGTVIRRNWSFQMSFLYFLPFLNLASQLAICSYKIDESGFIMV